MVRRLVTYLVLGAFPAAFCLAEDPRRFSHDGLVVDATTERPLRDAVATAYASAKLRDKTLCPKYDDFIDDDVASKHGLFVLHIPEKLTSYLVTYCHSGYVTFTRLANDNQSDDTPISPRPVRLFPRDGSGPEMFNAIARLRDAAQAAANVLSEDHEPFAAALKMLPLPERQLVVAWTKPVGGATSTAIPMPALEKLVNDFRVALTYFKTSKPAAFRNEVRKFEEVAAYAEQTLLTRKNIDTPANVDFSISLTTPRNSDIVTDDEVNVRGAITAVLTRHPNEPISPAIDMELKRRDLELLVAVRVMMRSFNPPESARAQQEEWHIHGPLVVQPNGIFNGKIVLSDDGHGRGHTFGVVVLVAPAGTRKEFDRLSLLPERSVSAPVTIQRGR